MVAGVAVAMAITLSGCGNLNYLAQSASGHLSLMTQRQPIEDVISDPGTTPQLRKKLQLLMRQREFAYSHLALPDNGSYRSFVALGRRYVTWIVVVTPTFSMQPVSSCFLIVGCVAYRGFFSEMDARTYAAGFAADKYDTYVGGAGAYSTLGWFADPVLSTMTARSEPGMAAVLFHELAHQRIYIADDTVFNESYAVAVEQVGVRRWFEHQKRLEDVERYARATNQRRQFTDLVAAAKARLNDVYAQSDSNEDKLAAKQGVFAWLRRQHEMLRVSWGGRSAYSRWVEGPLNNAKLVLVGTYAEYVQAFLALNEKSLDMESFHQAAERIAQLPVGERRRQLRELRQRSDE